MSTPEDAVMAERNWGQFVAREDFDELAPLAQGLFLQDAMNRMAMSKEQFAQRISISKKCLSKWMSRHGTSEFRNMPPIAWKFIGEILAHTPRQS
ncbi:hypothetical protein AU476_00980 [Cupriavidus sp. UYMSc13B]|nr:hypothetical protein AU476_00980 [Cupriavidus sp. UYMSc13B]